MSNPEISDEFPAASGEFSVTVTERGPLLVYGRPPLAVQSIVCDGEHESRAFREDKNRWLYTAVTRAKKKLILVR